MRSFFARESTSQTKPKAKGKAKAKASAAKVCRLAALDLLVALDTQVEAIVGVGLAQFVPDLGAALPPYAPHRQKLLTAITDEASSNLALCHWLMWKTQLRMVHMRDPLHREWNDVTDALEKAGLWSVVLLTTVVFNLAYGPWKGSAWWRKLQEGGAELAAAAGVGDQLVEELYEAICQDLGVEAFGDAERKAEILEFAAAGQLQARKGERVTLRRRFSWMSAARDHDQVWHARLLVITAIGVNLGLGTEAESFCLTRQM